MTGNCTRLKISVVVCTVLLLWNKPSVTYWGSW